MLLKYILPILSERIVSFLLNQIPQWADLPVYFWDVSEPRIITTSELAVMTVEKGLSQNSREKSITAKRLWHMQAECAREN